MTAPMAEGGIGTVVTRDEFNLTANSGGDVKDCITLSTAAIAERIFFTKNATFWPFTNCTATKNYLIGRMDTSSNTTDRFDCGWNHCHVRLELTSSTPVVFVGPLQWRAIIDTGFNSSCYALRRQLRTILLPTRASPVR